MSRRTRRLLFLFLAVATVAARGAASLRWPRTAVTPENAEKIQPGMTLAEVEAILGRPAGDDAGPGVCVGAGRCGDPMDARAAARHGPDPAGGVWQSWLSDQAHVALRFDARGRVDETRWFPALETRERFTDRLRRWLGL
jgi:hypothetical protein